MRLAVRERVLRATLLGLLPACSVTALAERERSIAVNECASDDECGQGACREGVCTALAGELTALLLELTPTAIAGSLAGKPLFQRFDLSKVDASAPGVEFDGAASVTGLVTPPLIPECADVAFLGLGGRPLRRAAGDQTIPVRVTFVPILRRLGIATESYVVQVDTRASENLSIEAPASYPFRAVLPIGERDIGAYDIYVEPRPLLDVPTLNAELRKRCELPPQLLLGQPLASSTNVALSIKLSHQAVLDLEVRFPSEQSLAGWKLDIIDSESGRLLSTTVTIPSDAKSGWAASLSYYPVAYAGDLLPNRKADDLVRLSPPPGLVAPTVLFQRSALELFQRGSGVVQPFDRNVPSSVVFEGQLLTRDGQAVTGSVKFTATRVLGVTPGVFATYLRGANTDEQGRFTTTLVPGTYRVEVLPFDSGSGPGFSVLETQWDVPAMPRRQSGRVVEVDPFREISGRALLPVGSTGVLGAEVVVEPSALAARPNVLGRALGEAPLTTRSLRTTVRDATGEFAFVADAGQHDFFVRPPDGSNLAWFVMPGLDVSGGTSLGAVRLPLPIRLESDAYLAAPTTLPVSSLAQSRLRAYAFVNSEGEYTSELGEAYGVVPVAETRLDAAGHFILNVPASLN